MQNENTPHLAGTWCSRWCGVSVERLASSGGWVRGSRRSEQGAGRGR